jgi:phosphoglycolate phosphatase
VIIFDVDGTLVDSRPGIVHALLETAQAAGVGCRPDDIGPWAFGPPLPVVLGTLVGAGSPERIRQLIPIFRRAYDNEGIGLSTVFAGVAELLGRLRQRGYQMIFASANEQPIVRRLCVMHGLSEFPSCIVGARDSHDHRSKIEIVREALRHANNIAAPLVVVGDTEADILLARALQVGVISVTYGYRRRDVLEDHRPDHFAASPQEVGRIIARNYRLVPTTGTS